MNPEEQTPGPQMPVETVQPDSSPKVEPEQPQVNPRPAVQNPQTPGQQPVQQPLTSPQPPAAPVQPQPIAAAQPNPQLNSSINTPRPAKKSRKKLIIIIIAILGVLGISGIVYAYLQNTPENVYKRGIASVGVGAKKLVSKVTEKDLKNTDITGNITVTKPVNASVGIKGYWNVDGQSQLTIDTDLQDVASKIEFISTAYDKENLPTFYFKTTKVEDLIQRLLTIGDISSTLGTDLDGVWHKISLQKLVDLGIISLDDTNKAISNKSSLTQQDYTDIANAIVDASTEYIWTSNNDDMAFQMQEYLGDEEFEGVNSSKYSVNINMNNIRKFIKKARDNIDATGVAKKLGADKPLNTYLSDEDIDREFKDDEPNDTVVNIWVAKNSKILRNIRFSPKNQDQYFDISVLLKDGSPEMPLRLQWTSTNKQNSGNINFIISVNTDDFTTKISSSATFSNLEYTASLSMTGSSESPAQTIPTPTSDKLFELITGTFKNTQVRALDVTTSLDINTIFQKLEEYYNDNGFYPLSPTVSSFPGIDPEALIDANGNSLFVLPSTTVAPSDTDTLNTSATSPAYNYIPLECTTTGCQAYVLYGVQQDTNYSGGNVYVKHSLN